MKIELSDELLDDIVLQVLKESKESLEDSLANAHLNRQGGVFDLDYDKDVMHLIDRIRCFEHVIDWYSVHSY
jgi:uncharacterized protein (UPF0371 family)